MKTATKPNCRKVARAITPAVTELLAAMVEAEEVRDEMDKIDNELLQANEYHVSAKHTQRRPGQAERITEPKHVYLMTDDDAEEYYALREDRIEADGWNVPERGYCPACMAEMKMLHLENRVINETFAAMGDTLTSDNVYGEKRKKMIDCCVGLALSAPR